MQRNYTRRRVVQARVQIDEFQGAVMIWFSLGFAFLGPALHIFPQITLPI
jgi:hypothetical protein